MSAASPSRARSACWAAWKTATARAAAGSITSPIPTRRSSLRSDRRGRAGDRHRHQPRRVQVHQEAGWFGAEDGCADRDSQAPAQDAPGDARQLFGAEGPAGRREPVRRQAEGDLGRAGRGDSARHSQWRAQDQRGYGQPSGHHGRHPQGAVGDARRSSIRATT